MLRLLLLKLLMLSNSVHEVLTDFVNCLGFLGDVLTENASPLFFIRLFAFREGHSAKLFVETLPDYA